jgi:alkyl hydroperoxide reductase subunit D
MSSAPATGKRAKKLSSSLNYFSSRAGFPPARFPLLDMTLESLLESTPAYAKDLKLNLSSLLRQTELTEQQIWGTAAACAIASRNPLLLETLLAEAQTHLSPQALEAAKTAAALMGMNNIYYRFLHLTSNTKYATIPARLRMNGIRTHGIDHNDFELWCVAVSAINGCGACVESHPCCGSDCFRGSRPRGRVRCGNYGCRGVLRKAAKSLSQGAGRELLTGV